MTISVGDRIPSVNLTRMTGDGPQAVSTDELCAGRKVVLFAVPGAFTPTCSAEHLPGYTANIDALRAKGVDAVACIATNDVFVMDAWGKDQSAEGKVEMLADGSGEFTAAMGLEFDLRAAGLGVRSKRYALVAEDGVVKTLNVEDGAGLDVSSAETILGAL